MLQSLERDGGSAHGHHEHIVARTQNLVVDVHADDRMRTHGGSTSLHLMQSFRARAHQLVLVSGRPAADDVANARISVVGYPAISARNGAVCPLRTSAPGSSEAGFNMDYAGLVRTGEDQVNSAMYKAARANGVQYYNLRADSIDHGMCAPDNSRWISGKWEYSVPHNLFNHLTHLGNRNVAQLLNSKVLAH